MTRRFTVADAVALIEGDHEVVERLRECGLCMGEDGSFSAAEMDALRVAHVLVRELEVNWAGVEVAIALRERLLAVTRQVEELVELMRQSREQHPPR